MYHRGVVVLGVRSNISMMAKQTNSDRSSRVRLGGLVNAQGQRVFDLRLNKDGVEAGGQRQRRKL